MLTLFALPLILVTQAVLSIPAEPSFRELRDLADLLDAERRYADELAFEKRDDEDLGEFLKKCKQDPLELGLVIDASVSIKVEDFKEGLKFLSSFLSDYIIGPGKNEVRVAAIAFAKGVYEEDGFNLTSDRAEVMHRVKTMAFRRGPRTDTGLGLRYMRDVQLQNTRSWAPKVAVVLTDGNSQDRRLTKSEALKCKAANITVFAVGVGKQVKYSELLNIAGGEPNQVFTSDSYSSLTQNVKEALFTKTCKLVPKPTTLPPPTTTTTPQATQPCGTEYPTDVNFVFSPASLGTDGTSFVTSFVSRFMSDDELVEGGFQYGVLSADCPYDEGFRLDRYSDVDSIRDRLHEYDRSNLPRIISQTYSKRFGTDNGGRADAHKVAVIFVGESKMDSRQLKEAFDEMQANGVKVFISATSQRAYHMATGFVPEGARLLEYGPTSMQAAKLVSYLCHSDEPMA